jgi:hypothetical protein
VRLKQAPCLIRYIMAAMSRCFGHTESFLQGESIPYNNIVNNS